MDVRKVCVVHVWRNEVSHDNPLQYWKTEHAHILQHSCAFMSVYKHLWHCCHMYNETSLGLKAILGDSAAHTTTSRPAMH